MVAKAIVKLEEIKKLNGTEELVALCQDILDRSKYIRVYDAVDEFLKMNYVFAIDPGYGFSTVYYLFQEFLIEVFCLDAEEEKEEEDEEDEEEEEDEVPPKPSMAFRGPSKYKGMLLTGASDLSPRRSRDTEPYTCSKFQERSYSNKKFGFMELIDEEVYLETTDMDKFLSKVSDSTRESVVVFHIPFIDDEKDNTYCKVIGQHFPITVVKFRKPSDDELVTVTKNIIKESCSDVRIDDEQAKTAIKNLKQSGGFTGYKSLGILTQKLIYNKLLEKAAPKEDISVETFDSLSVKYHKLDDSLKTRISGQDRAIAEMVQGLFASDLKDISTRKGPKASFLLIGPPGVGKTLIAQTLADTLNLPSLILNMSDYSEEKAHIDLIGSSKRFTHGSEGSLVKFVRQNPKGIVVFDEIEKAHLNTIHLLLQVLDMGVLLDSYTEQYIDFSNSIIIFTSNVGRSLYDDDRNKDLSRLPKKILVDAIENEKRPDGKGSFFPQAICSRMSAGNIIMLNRMDTDTLLSIVSDAMSKAAVSFATKFGYKFDLSSEVSNLFMYQQGKDIDARVASKKSEEFIRRELYELARLMKQTPDLLNGIDAISFRVAADKEFADLINASDATGNVLYIGEPPFADKIDGEFKVKYVNNLEDTRAALEEEFNCILLDPYLGSDPTGNENLCVNDMDSVGINILHNIAGTTLDCPIYVVDKFNSFTDTDEDSFALDGVTDCVMAGHSAADLTYAISLIVSRQNMINRHEDFCNRGYCLDFSSRQFVEGNELIIEFYDLRKRMVPDSGSAKLMVSDAERPNVKLTDIIGAQEAKDELKFFVNYLKNPRSLAATGARAPRGLLLYGPPGTGKTMLAKALAGESDAAFISTSAAEFLAPYRGEGEEKVKALFATARRYAPSIIFIDEIDAIGKLRTGINDGSAESILNVLLTEMDGFKTNAKKPVFVLAATNFGMSGDADKKVPLDPALLRRFDNQIFVDLPKESERMQYLGLYRDKNDIAKYSDEAIDNIAKRSIGRSIAELENILALAERNALKKGTSIDDALLVDAYEQSLYGLKKEQKEEHYRATAIHEAGHAYIAHISGNTPTFITITGRANFAGYVMPAIDEDKGSYTEQEYRWMIREKLAGRIAEKVLLGGEDALNTGASNDLQQATRDAINMVARYGFVGDQLITLSPAYVEKFGWPKEYLELANKIILEEQAECERLIEAGKDKVLKLAEAVMENNNLMTEGIRQVLE